MATTFRTTRKQEMAGVIFMGVFLALYIIKGAAGLPEGQGPVNTVIQDGDTAVLGCQFTYAESIDWYRNYADWLSSGPDIYSPAVPWIHSILVDPNTNAYDLEIYGATRASDAAHYFCTFLDTELGLPYKLYKYHARLVIIDGSISCLATFTVSDGTSDTLESTVSRGDSISVTCSLTYGGPWAPQLNCASDVFKSPTITNTTSDTEARYVHVYTVPSGETSGEISCSAVLVDDGNIPPDGVVDAEGADYFYARNIPTIGGVWTTGVLHIEYAPVDTVIEPIKSEYDSDDKIACSADGNPAASIMWVNVATNDVISSDVSLAVGNYGGVTVTCVATNSKGSSTSSEILIAIQEDVFESTAAEETSKSTTTSSTLSPATDAARRTDPSTVNVQPTPPRTPRSRRPTPPTPTPTAREQTSAQTPDGPTLPWWAILVLVLTCVAVLAAIIGATVYVIKYNRS